MDSGKVLAVYNNYRLIRYMTGERRIESENKTCSVWLTGDEEKAIQESPESMEDYEYYDEEDMDPVDEEGFEIMIKQGSYCPKCGHKEGITSANHIYCRLCETPMKPHMNAIGDKVSTSFRSN